MQKKSVFALWCLNLILVGCGGLDSPSETSSSSASVLANGLTVTATSNEVSAGQAITLTASGGTAQDYIFTLVGQGSLSTLNESATYTAPSSIPTESNIEIYVGNSNGEQTKIAIKLLQSSIPAGKQIFDLAGSGSFTIPAEVRAIRVVVVGAGGGAGAPGAHTTLGATTLTWGGGAGGGGAGGVCRTRVAVTPGQSLSFTIGQGGIGATFAGGTFTGINANGGAGGPTLFGMLVAAGGTGGAGGTGSFLSASGAGGLGGQGGGCPGAGSLPSTVGPNGSPGAASSTVAGNQMYFHADGGAGGLGHMLDSKICGQGATGAAKSAPFMTVSPAGQAGCVLIEWGPGI